MPLPPHHPKLTTCSVPNLPLYDPNLTDNGNVPKIEQCLLFGTVNLSVDRAIFSEGNGNYQPPS
jgi:hypothetical protein